MLFALLVVGSVVSAQSPVVFDGGLLGEYGLIATPDGTLPLPGIGLSLSAGPRLIRDIALVGMVNGEVFFAPDGITVSDGALLVGIQLGPRGHANLGVGLGYSLIADATASVGQFSFAAAVTAVAPILSSAFGFHFRLAFTLAPGGIFLLTFGVGLGGSVT